MKQCEAQSEPEGDTLDLYGLLLLLLLNRVLLINILILRGRNDDLRSVSDQDDLPVFDFLITGVSALDSADCDDNKDKEHAQEHAEAAADDESDSTALPGPETGERAVDAMEEARMVVAMRVRVGMVPAVSSELPIVFLPVVLMVHLLLVVPDVVPLAHSPRLMLIVADIVDGHDTKEPAVDHLVRLLGRDVLLYERQAHGLAEGVGKGHALVFLHGARAAVGLFGQLVGVLAGDEVVGYGQADAGAINVGYVAIGSGGVESGKFGEDHSNGACGRMLGNTSTENEQRNGREFHFKR